MDKPTFREASMHDLQLVEPSGRRSNLSLAQLNQMLEAAAEEGAVKALARVGLQDEKAIKDVGDLRELLASWRDLRSEGRKMLFRLFFLIVLVLLAFLGRTELIKLIF